jgi:peptide/nickel transport system substrate-binding protein
MRAARFALALLFTFFAFSHAEGDGPLVFGQTFLADSTDPTEGSTAWALISHGVAEKLFTVNETGDVIPQVAASVSKVDDLGNVWDIVLKDGYEFSDGTPVTADLVAQAISELNEKNPSAQSSLGAIDVEPTDDLTLRVETELPTHIMDSVLAEWAFPVYKKDEGGDFVYTGPYVVDHFEPEDHIDLIPNVHYPQVDERSNIEVKKFEDGNALAQALEAGEVDVAFHLPIDTLPGLRDASDGDLTVKSFDVGYQYMAFYNLCQPQMADRKVRQAIDVAISRNELSQALQGGVGTRSFFPDHTPFFSDESDANDDTRKAEELLEEAGWTLDPETGMRTNNQGEELTVKLVAYPQRPGLVTMQPVIEQTLQGLGIAVDTVLTGSDWSETQEIIDEGDFDMLMWAQHTLPAGDPGWFLNSFFRTEGSKNMGCFASDAVDELLNDFSPVEEHSQRVEATANVQAAVLEEVPVSSLVTPAWHVGLSKRMADYKPWGADYYVIRPYLTVEEIERNRQRLNS